MASKKKLLQAAAGSAGGAGLDIDECFSCHLYEGTGSAQTITNGIDLAGEGGIVWLKDRGDTTPHTIHTTDIGALNYLVPHYTAGNNAGVAGYGLTAFNSDGFSLGTDYEGENGSGDSYVSWTFRKAPKFFDVVTWTGNGVAGRTISHNLGSVPGMIWVKQTGGSTAWQVYHSATGNNQTLQLNTTDAAASSTKFNSTDPTSSVFSVNDQSAMNGSGNTYVAYLFAHNNNDGDFGPDSDQDIIKCGSYTGNGSSTGPVIDCGFEPQWIMVKRASGGTGGYFIFDAMRGIVTGGNDSTLQAESSGAEGTGDNRILLTATGFQIETTSSFFNNSGDTYIYMAIRRGSLNVPDDATKVFNIDTLGGTSPSPPGYTSGFPVDMAFHKHKGNTTDILISSRLTGAKELKTHSADAESSSGGASAQLFDYQDGYYNFGSAISDYTAWMWKRAPSYFDVVAYTGTGSARTVSHNLTVPPEMIWVKQRGNTTAWQVYHSATGNNQTLQLNTTDAAASSTKFNSTDPTSSVFSVSNASAMNGSGNTYIAYLFATVAGVSKLGSVTHSSGSTTNVDCGFAAGARFVLVKSTGIGYWRVWDSVRGIVAGNDPYLHLNDNSAQVTNSDFIDPYSSGFALAPSFYTDTYIFYAIA